MIEEFFNRKSNGTLRLENTSLFHLLYIEIFGTNYFSVLERNHSSNTVLFKSFLLIIFLFSVFKSSRCHKYSNEFI